MFSEYHHEFKDPAKRLNKFLEQTPIQRGVYVNLGALFQVLELTFFRYNEFASITFLLLSRFVLGGHRNYVTDRNRTLSLLHRPQSSLTSTSMIAKWPSARRPCLPFFSCPVELVIFVLCESTYTVIKIASES